MTTLNTTTESNLTRVAARHEMRDGEVIVYWHTPENGTPPYLVIEVDGDLPFKFVRNDRDVFVQDITSWCEHSGTRLHNFARDGRCMFCGQYGPQEA